MIAVSGWIGSRIAALSERRSGDGDAELNGAARPTAAAWLQCGFHLIVGGLVVDLRVTKEKEREYGVIDEIDRELAVF